jgi:excisionase family DNA binding protein
MKQAAEMLGVSQPTVRKIMHSGRLRFNKCGLIPIEQVDKLLAVTE